MKDGAIRIAHIVGKMNSGGVESFIMNYYRNIDKKKIQFDFIVDMDSNVPQYDEIIKLGGNIIKISPYENLFKYIKDLKRVFKDNNYIIVHSHLNALSVIPLSVAFFSRIPIRIAHSHSTTNKKEWKKNLLKNLLKPFSKVFATDYYACTNHSAEWLFGKKFLEDKKVTIINNAIDVNKFKYDFNKRIRVRNELSINDCYVLGNVGRFVQQKNHEYLIDLFEKLYKQDDRYRLMLIGEGPLEVEIKNKLKKKQIDRGVLFIGTTDKVEEYMCAMDLFVFPSLYEGLGMVVVEAQACGLPCIVSKNVPEDVNITRNVEFLELKDIEDWTETINIYRNKNIDRSVDINDFVKKHYSINENSNTLECNYINLLRSINIRGEYEKGRSNNNTL